VAIVGGYAVPAIERLREEVLWLRFLEGNRWGYRGGTLWIRIQGTMDSNAGWTDGQRAQQRFCFAYDHGRRVGPGRKFDIDEGSQFLVWDSDDFQKRRVQVVEVHRP
jgi:hypothetical protein